MSLEKIAQTEMLRDGVKLAFNEALKLFVEKGKTCGNSWVYFGLIGRLNDVWRKFARIKKALIDTDAEAVDLDKFVDETIDLLNYSAMLHAMARKFVNGRKSVLTKQEFRKQVDEFNRHLEENNLMYWTRKTNGV